LKPIVHGFKEIIQGMNLEGAQGVLLVGGEKDHRWQILAGQDSENFKSIHAGHRHVEEDNIGRELKNFIDRRWYCIRYCPSKYAYFQRYPKEVTGVKESGTQAAAASLQRGLRRKRWSDSEIRRGKQREQVQ
jgi:hypothetical protein